MNATIPLSGSPSKPVRRGFPSVTCIKCGNADAVVTVNLTDVSEFHCNECDEDFSAADVREFVGQWQAVLNWIELCPAVED
ncbi:MAG TPA: hypothetical protein VN688_00985 [Gemmataceae bacterium]|nr:hypothetical protein [Gemmataceae bacterium]